MDGQGSPSLKTRKLGKRQTLIPAAVVCLFVSIISASHLNAQQSSLSNSDKYRPSTSLPSQELPLSPLRGDSLQPPPDNSLTAFPANRSADNPAENQTESSVFDSANTTASSSRPVRLKVTLGGEKSVRWEGHIRLQSSADGRWENLGVLSIEPAAVGLIRLAPNSREITIRHSESLSYNSFHVNCRADAEAQLEIQLRSPDNPQWSFYQTVPLAQLIDAPWSLPLANSGHGIWIERPSEDQIHIESSLKRDILELGEGQEIAVIPNRLRIARGTALKYHARVIDITAQNEQVWEARGDLESDQNGDYKPLPIIQLAAGANTGVYQFQVDITLARTALTSLLPNSMAGNPIVATRQMQWVVVPAIESGTLAPKSTALPEPSREPKDPQVAVRLTIDHSNLSVSPFRSFELQRLPWLPRLQSFQRTVQPTFATRSSESLRGMEIEGKDAWDLGSEQWRIIEFPTLEAGWYWIDVEIMNADAAQLALDLVQTDQWNRVPHWTTGSVWNANTDPLLSQVSGTGTIPDRLRNWRTLHWVNPTASHPATLLCLTNRSQEAPVRIGSIVVSQVDFDSAPDMTALRGPSRGVGYYMETPLLTSIFSGRKPSPTANSPPLNDWLSYHDAAERLVQFLVVKKYNTVWLPVLKQGGPLFPLDGVQTLPRFENSSFGTLAQPHSRLDVVELLLRKLDSQHLAMVPVLDLSVRLPKVGDATASEPNPLDSNFQQEVLEIIEQFAARYHRHKSLRGIAIELGPDCPLLFRSESDGLSATTVARFLSENSLTWPAHELGRIEDAAGSVIEQWVLQNHTHQWLLWRSNELRKFFTQTQAKLAALSRPINHSRLELHLVVTGLHRQPILRDSLYPSLRGRPTWTEHWLKLGLNLETFQSNEDGVNLFVQQTTKQNSDIAIHRRANVTSHTTDFWQALEKLSELSFMTQQALRQTVVEAMAETPSDHVGQAMLTFGVVSGPVGCEAAWAEAMRRQDACNLANQTGGLPRTEHLAEQAFALAFAQLNRQPFATLYQDSTSPVTIRQSQPQHGKSQIYVVNAAGWPVTCGLDVAGVNSDDSIAWTNVVTKQLIQPTALANSDNRLQPAGFVRNPAASARLTLTLSPYSLTVLEGPAIQVSQVTINEAAADANPRLAALQASLFRRLRQASTNATPIQAIQNSGFEEELTTTSANNASNWVHGQLKTGQSIARDSSTFHNGAHSLRIQNSEGVVWLRSNSIAASTTGRLSVTAWVRNHPERPVDSLRLSIDGQGSDGRKYYRFGEIPLLRTKDIPNNTQSQSSEWQPIAVHFDDLPEEGLANIRIGLDLMKPGDLWIDSVQCFDRWLDANDQNVLSNRLGLVAYSLETKHNTWAALQTLDDYWLRFLLAYVPDPNETAEVGRSQPGGLNAAPVRNARGRRFLPLR